MSELPGLALMEEDLRRVEDRLRQESRSEVRLVMDVADHILGSGGKRFRPLLMLLCARMLGLSPTDELLAYASAIEFAHTATLLHDDVIDEADLRRGDVSANRVFGNSASIIVGDYLLFKCFGLVLRGENLGIVRLLAEVALEMAEGEAYQLTQKQRVDLSEDEYLRIIRSKTALLIQAACEIPAIAAGASDRQRAALKEFGYRLGVAFQMADDVLDYAAAGEGWGKKVGKDFLEGKSTLPLIMGHRRAGAADRELLKSLFYKNPRSEAEFEQLRALLVRIGALDAARARAREEATAAVAALDLFPASPARSALIELAEFVVARER